MSHLLSVISDKDGQVIYIHADKEGLEELAKNIAQLQKNLEKGECEHTHLMSEEWGGASLTSSMLEQEKEQGCIQVHHIKIYAWTDEWKAKHNLGK